MGTVRVTMYGVECDNCKVDYDGECYVLFDESQALKEVENDGWHVTDDKETYCPQCFTLDENDELIIKTERKKEIELL